MIYKCRHKKVDGVKFSELFESGRGKRKLNFNRNDKEYIEVVRKKHFPLYPYKNFCQTYKRKAAKVRVKEPLSGARRQLEASKSCFSFL